MENYLTLTAYADRIKEAVEVTPKEDQTLNLYQSKDPEGNYFYKVYDAIAFEVRYVEKHEFKYSGTESLYCIGELEDMYKEECEEEDQPSFKKWVKENYVKVLLL